MTTIEEPNTTQAIVKVEEISQLELVVSKSGIESQTAQQLLESFRPIFANVHRIVEEAKAAPRITDATQLTEMRKVRAIRLALAAERIKGDKMRESMKAEGLRRNAAIQGVYNLLKFMVEPMEETLLESEKFAERAEAARKAALNAAREAELKPLTDCPWMGADLGEMTQADYEKVLSDAKLLRQAKIDAATKRELERIAKEEAERIERERIAVENARLKAEKEEVARLAEEDRQRIEAERAKERREREAKHKEEIRLAKLEADRFAEIVRKEHEAIEAKAKAERDKAAKEAARLKAELAAKEKAAADAKAKLEADRQAAEKSEREAAAAPDKAKLKAFAVVVRSLPQPALRNETLGALIADRVEQLAVWIETQKPEDKI